MAKIKIGIIGNGFVGKATQLLKSNSIDIIVYDIRPEACYPEGTQLNDMESCDLVFICLPTPLNHDSSCYTKIIEETVNQISNPFKIIRSTVPVGFSESVGCFFMPEFLTEANWINDFICSSHWIFGLRNIPDLDNKFKEKVINLFTISQQEGSIQSSQIYWLTNSEAEFLKLAKNCFLAAKVGIMNELYQFAKIKQINYNNVKEILKLDPRIGSTHLDVPGINNRFGYGGTCFPKDTHSLYSQYQSVGLTSYYWQNSLIRNEYEDRKEREWTLDYWRTTIPTNKKINLFISQNMDIKLEYFINNLLIQDQIVIYLNPNPDFNSNSNNFIWKKATIENKNFFPKLDKIYYHMDSENHNYNELIKHIKGTINILELVKIHNCELVVNQTDNYLIESFKKSNPQYNIISAKNFENLSK